MAAQAEKDKAAKAEKERKVQEKVNKARATRQANRAAAAESPAVATGAVVEAGPSTKVSCFPCPRRRLTVD